jgi:hypothetical protein
MREEAYFLYERERQYQVRFPHVTVPMFPDFTFGLYPVLLFYYASLLSKY